MRGNEQVSYVPDPYIYSQYDADTTIRELREEITELKKRIKQLEEQVQDDGR